MRLFVSSRLPKTVCAEVSEIMRQLPKPQINPVDEDNLHFTLEFLGEVEEKNIPGIIIALEKISSSKFSARLAGLGAFPNQRRPNVVFLDCGLGSEHLVSLAKNVETALQPLGFFNDKPFRPHLTIGRVKSSVDLEEFFSNHADFSTDEFGIGSFALVGSQLTPNGPEYKNVKLFPLRD